MRNRFSRSSAPLRLRLAAPPEETPDNLDDNQGDEPAEDDVAEVMAAEGEPQHARANSERESGGDRRSAPRRRRDTRRRNHPEAGRRLARRERTVPLAGAVVVIPGHERIGSVERPGLDRAGAVPMVLEAEIDDESRA